MEIADILMHKVKDPRIGFVTVTAVKVTEDLRSANIYVSGFGADAQATLEGLKKARGFMRGELGRRLKLRFTPELSFSEDRAAEEASRLDRIMDEMKKPGDREGAPPADPV